MDDMVDYADFDGEDDFQSSSEEDPVAVGEEWDEIPFNEEDVTLSFSNVDEMLMNHAAEELEGVANKMSTEQRGQLLQQTGPDFGLGSFYCFFSPNIVSLMMTHIQEYIEGGNLMTPGEFQAFIRLIFWLCFFRVSPTELFDNREAYSCAQAEIDVLPFNRFMAIHAALGCSEQRRGLAWTAHFDSDRFMVNFDAEVSKQASKVAYVKGVTNMTIDDDKMKNRSKKCAEEGWSRSKGKSSFGPVNNCVNSMRTGICLASHITHFGQSALDVTKINLLHLAGIPLIDNANFGNALLGNDRGYHERRLFVILALVALQLLNTVKRGPSFPFKWGTTSYITTKFQKVIPVNGPMAVYGARKVGISPNRPLYLTAYRSGTGRVTFLQCTKKEAKPFNFKYVAANSQDRKRFEDAIRGVDQEIPGGCFVAEILTENECILLTRVQGSPEWFILRRFRLTSTVGHAVLPRVNHSMLSPAEYDLIHNCIELADTTPQPEALQHDHATYRDMDVSFLASSAYPRLLLLEICKQWGLPSTGSKRDLAERIKKGPKTPETKSLMDVMLSKFFMRPLKKGSFALGSANESLVRRAVKECFAALGYSIEKDIAEVGLICQNIKRYIATSLDGLIRVKAADATVSDVAVEIKTATNSETVLLMKERVENGEVRRFSAVRFNSEEFRRAVPDKSHRTQLLHHATTLKLSKVLYMAATDCQLVYAVLIEFPEQYCKTYESILDKAYTEHLSWAYVDNPQLPHNLNGKIFSSTPYPVTLETIALHLSLWKKLSQWIDLAKLPLPVARLIVPYAVVLWNRVKGPIDVMSHYLADIHFNVASSRPRQVHIIRSNQTAALNGFLAEKFVSSRDLLKNYETYDEFRDYVRRIFKFKSYIFKLAKHYNIPKSFWGQAGEISRRPVAVVRPPPKTAFQMTQVEAEAYCAHRLAGKNRNVLKKFETDAKLAWIRSNRNFDHTSVNDDVERQCAGCAPTVSRTVKRCKTCYAHICGKRAVIGEVHTCFSKWHDKEN